MVTALLRLLKYKTKRSLYEQKSYNTVLDIQHNKTNDALASNSEINMHRGSANK
jgi:hypothetical protein